MRKGTGVYTDKIKYMTRNRDAELTNDQPINKGEFEAVEN